MICQRLFRLSQKKFKSFVLTRQIQIAYESLESRRHSIVDDGRVFRHGMRMRVARSMEYIAFLLAEKLNYLLHTLCLRPGFYSSRNGFVEFVGFARGLAQLLQSDV